MPGWQRDCGYGTKSLLIQTLVNNMDYMRLFYKWEDKTILLGGDPQKMNIQWTEISLESLYQTFKARMLAESNDKQPGGEK